MKKIIIILSLLYFALLLSACTKDQEENTTDPTETPTPQSSNSNQISNPNSQVHEIKAIRINQDLTLKENTLNIEAADGLVYTHPIYYGNSKCVLANIAGKGRLKGDPWAKKQLKKNETYKAFGFDLVTSIRRDKYNAPKPPYTRFTIRFESKTTESVYLWIDCFGDKAAQITSPADIEKLLDNVISFVDEEGSENLNVFGPSSSQASRLLGSDESMALKRLHLNMDEFTEYHKNEKCILSVSGSHYTYLHYEHFLYYIEFKKGKDTFFEPPFSTLNIVFRNDFGVYTNITCKGDDLTLSTSPSDIEKLLDNKFTFH